MLLRKLVSFCALLGLVGCFNNEDTVSAPKSVDGSISFRVAIPPSSPFKEIAKTALLEIRAPDMNTIKTSLEINDSAIEGRANNIPAGKNRTFLVKVYDSASVECYRGSAEGDIKKDSVTAITLVISRRVGSAVINGTINEGQNPQVGPFLKDNSTIFLADFNDNLTDFVSGNSGKLTGGTFAGAVFGKAIRFNSVRHPKVGYVFPSSSLISVDSGSIEALVNVQTLSDGFMHIVDKSWQYGLTVHNGQVAVNFGRTWWYSGYSVPVEKWTYLCGTYDGTTIGLYANGVLVKSSPYSLSASDPSYALGIGNATDSGFDIPFLGSIDELRISKRARTEAEVKANWKAIDLKIPH